MPDIDLIVIILINGDYLAGPATEAASKLRQFLRRADIPAAFSRARGWNAFTWAYRADCISFGKIASLQPFTPQVSIPPPDGETLLTKLLGNAIEKR